MGVIINPCPIFCRTILVNWVPSKYNQRVLRGYTDGTRSVVLVRFSYRLIYSRFPPCLEEIFITMWFNDLTMGSKASQITSLTIVYSAVYSGADQRKHQSSASLAFVRGIHRGPLNSPHKWPGTWKKFPFDDVIMWRTYAYVSRESPEKLLP